MNRKPGETVNRSKTEDARMSADDSIAGWIEQLSSGDSRGAQAIWNEYFERLAFLRVSGSAIFRGVSPMKRTSRSARCTVFVAGCKPSGFLN